MIMAPIQSKLKTSGEAFPDSAERGFAAATSLPGGRGWLSPGWDTRCASVMAEGAQEQAGKAVAWSSRGLGSSTPTAQLACTALPALGKPGRIPHPPFPRTQVAAGIKVPHSPRVCCQLSAQHPFSSSLWKLPVHGLCFACVLRRGSSSKGVFVLGFAV